MLPMLDITQWEDATPDSSFVVADGRSVTIGVRDKCLHIKDGPNGKRERTFVKPQRARGIKHLMILGGHGYTSTEAKRWLADAGVTWVEVDMDGVTIRDTTMPRVLGTSGAFVNPMLERRQAACYPGESLQDRGVAIIRRFLSTKLRGQAAVAERRFSNPDIGQYIRGLCADIAVADNTKTLLGIEGEGAAAYWSVWKGLAPTWKRPAPLQAHWLNYPGRASLRYAADDGNNRNATDPVNASLNYGYKILESEATLALFRQNLSPSMGILHVDPKDQHRRNSMALDLMEVARPAVDEIVLDIMSEPLAKNLFSQDKNGIVRVEAPLTHRIAARVHETAYHLVPDVSAMLAILKAPVGE